MSSVGTLQDGAELRVANASLLAGGAHRARADAHLDDVCARQDQLLHHLPRHHVTSLHNTTPTKSGSGQTISDKIPGLF